MSHPRELAAFECDLVSALQPIRGLALASAIYAFFEAGLAQALSESSVVDVEKLSEDLVLERERVVALLEFLVVEGFVRRRGREYSLAPKGDAILPYRAWYTMLVGGYGGTFLQLGQGLRCGAKPLDRDLGRVGSGSCGISHFDAIPLCRSLLADAGGDVRRVLDIGCGDASYLAELGEAIGAVESIGVEPSRRGYAEALQMVASAGLTDRITLYNMGAREFIGSDVKCDPDLLILSFVLHEILGQDGEEGVEGFLLAVRRRFPGVRVAVVEVDGRPLRPAEDEHPLGVAYYNPYFLLHAFTGQRLEWLPFWSFLFARVGYRVVGHRTVDSSIDSTGREVGFLLEPVG